MGFLTEATIQQIPEAKRLAQARLSKLGNIKLHLKQLLAKKLRLELEIQHVTTVIKKRSITDSKELRLKLHLEQGTALDQIPERLRDYEIVSPELLDLLKRGDDVAEDLIRLLEEEELVTPTEIYFLGDNL